MYYLVDLKEKKTATFRTKLDLLYYRFSKPERRPLWYNPQEIIPRVMDFSELNVTGKDIVIGFELVSGKSFFSCYEKVATLRRYMVTDELGKSIDIRTWLPEIVLVESGQYQPTYRMADSKQPMYRREPCGQGRKHHFHRVGCPAMWHRSMAEAAGVEDLALEADVRPLRNRSGIRKRGIEDEAPFEKAERRISRSWTCSKSWKDQTKAGRQWAKHKQAKDGRFLREGIEDLQLLCAYPDFEDDDDCSCWGAHTDSMLCGEQT